MLLIGGILMLEPLIQKKLVLDFILPANVQQFEQQAINLYADCMGQLPPNILDITSNYFEGQYEETFVPAFLGMNHLNPLYFEEITRLMSKNERISFIKEVKKSYQQQCKIGMLDPYLYEDVIYQDLISVFNYNHMCYKDMSGYKNPPVKEVW